MQVYKMMYTIVIYTCLWVWIAKGTFEMAASNIDANRELAPPNKRYGYCLNMTWLPAF